MVLNELFVIGESLDDVLLFNCFLVDVDLEEMGYVSVCERLFRVSLGLFGQGLLRDPCKADR